MARSQGRHVASIAKKLSADPSWIAGDQPEHAEPRAGRKRASCALLAVSVVVATASQQPSLH